ncbi:MAG: ABC transporter ATP-binding protein [Pseudomonadota bacterium]
MAGLRLDDLGKDYGTVTAVDGVTLDLPDGGVTALLGPSGCGKTTLLRMIAGLEAPSRGRLLIDGQDITDMPAEARRFGMVFQSFALFPHLTVADNVAYALMIAGMPKAQRRTRAEELLSLVQLPGYGGRRIAQLSGGQRQRVAIARALAQEPLVFLLDEPMSALDAKLREEMQVELRLLQQRLGITTVVVTHDQREAMTMADRIVVMQSGRVEQVGTPQEIYHQPASAFVAGFIGKANMLDGRAAAGAIALEGGTLAPVTAAPFIDGAPVTVACRPERLSLAPAGADDRAPNRLTGQVAFVRDVGQVREIHVQIGPHALTAELPAADRTAYAIGDAVAVAFPADALHVYPAETAAKAA